ncbi:MAG: sodium-dependent transporter [Bacteroidetes bacterium]|nr:sodium-dependent transporter [Bacteroidota bacterium]
MSRSETFSSRWGMMLAMLSLAVGTGNVWRFPRIAATNDGGTFLIPWLIFLFAWSIPLLMIEFTIGKSMRAGPVESFGKLIGSRFRWMGLWVAFTATAIMFYYSVVTGWCLRFFIAAVTGEIPDQVPGSFWHGFEGSWQAVLAHVAMMAAAAALVYRGVRGIERIARILLPTLLVLIAVLMLRAITLPNAHIGLNFLFTVHWGDLANAEIWLQALTQNAWDTGAGWGLILTYAIYARGREDTTLNAAMIGFGNNSISLMAGILVLCTIFSVRPDAAIEIVGAGNNGLTFIWVPQLFSQMPGGQVFMAVFFLALLFAAFTSLVSMVELATRVLMDRKIPRPRAVLLVGIAGVIFGLPSALSPSFFNNQDAVWGIGLMVSGLLFAVAVIKFGARKFRLEHMNTDDSDFTLGPWWRYLVVFVLLEAVVLLVWWLSQTISQEGWAASLDPFADWSLGTVLLQWGIALGIFIWWNRRAERGTLIHD